MKLSVLIPVYNERKTLSEIVSRVLKQKIKGIQALEIVIVDDASTDNSAEIIRDLAKKHREINPVFQGKNQGKGAAIRKAIEVATGDLAIIQDADLEYTPTDYPAMLTPIIQDRADVVYGSRFVVSGERRVLYFKHAMGNRFLTLLSNWFSDLYLTDMETCYKAFRLKLMKTIPLRSNRFGIEPEITAKIAKREFRVYEVPIEYHGRTYAEGKKIGWKDGFSAIYTILKYWIIDDMFEENYGHRNLAELQDAHRLVEWRLELIRPFLGNIVLEIGSGIGSNVRLLLAYSEAVIATDTDEKYLAILKNSYEHTKAVSIHQWDISQRPPAFKNQPDTIFCDNVLGRIENETLAIQHIHQGLLPGGRLILVVPQGPHLFSKLDQSLNYRRRYSETDLRQILTQNGFQVDQLLSFNKAGVVGWFWRGKIRKKSTLGKANLKLYNVLVPLLKLCEFIFPWKGLSWIVIAKKI